MGHLFVLILAVMVSPVAPWMTLLLVMGYLLDAHFRK
jgi:hypothetical protein